MAPLVGKMALKCGGTVMLKVALDIHVTGTAIDCALTSTTLLNKSISAWSGALLGMAKGTQEATPLVRAVLVNEITSTRNSPGPTALNNCWSDSASPPTGVPGVR